MRTPIRMLGGATAVLVGLSMLGLPAGALAAPGQVGTPRYTAGASGAGDHYFPFAGNGGYDVQHYDLDIRYTPPVATVPPTPTAQLRGQMEAVATIDLVATADLDAFNLDLRGLEVQSISVDGKRINPSSPGSVVDGPVWWQVQDDDARIWELTIQPRPKLKEGESAQVVVTYGGETIRPTDIEGVLYGWVTTRDGAMVVNEPEGSMTWFPVSDHPTDKATYSFEITVPEGKTAVANGLPSAPPATADGWTTWSWEAPDLQASYLATATVGDFDLRTSETSTGLPIIDAVDRKLTPAALATTNASLALQADMIAFFEDTFGDYPFNSYGSIVDNDSVGYALETQTRPVYSTRAVESTVAHELAHQWLGNAVSPARWQDIWLNEGWATYAEMLWEEDTGGTTAQEAFDDFMTRPANDPYWEVVVADPGPFGLFLGQIYDRGAATLHALRVKIGDTAFFAGAQEWVSRYDDSTATTEDLQAVYEEASGLDLDAFFDIWLRNPVKPANW